MASATVFGNMAINKFLAPRPIAWWRDQAGPWLSSNVNGKISGIVKRDGVAVEGAWVELGYQKGPWKYILARTRSKSDGSFIFSPNESVCIGLDPGENHYFVVAHDPQDSLNAVIFDLLTPVAV